MFNEYAWTTYLKAGGRNICEMFGKNLTEEYTEQYANEIQELRRAYCPSKNITDDVHEQLKDLCEGFYFLEYGEYSIESALEALWNWIVDGNENIKPSQIFEVFTTSMAFFTTHLCMEIPELFIPYYFKYNYNIFVKIADEFEIDLPEIPAKKDYEGRFYHYGEICASLIDFRDAHKMTTYELCAFLYDYAPKYVGGTSYIIENLPEPKSAFFIGGSKNDLFLSDEADTITLWQCNPDTRAGDMIVMYMRTPVSAVNSIWRSVSVGFNDPFFYYYRCTYIGAPVSIERITHKQLQSDEILGKMPIVKKNMQGINGVEMKPSEYNHLIDLSGANVLRLEYVLENDNTDFTCEKDVENKLIKPLLEKLCYSENEYEQQLRIEIGNHNATEIPDFALLPVKTRGQQTACAIIEAKRAIPNAKEFEEVKIQARSYARQLCAEYAVIASKDKIWVSSRKDDFVEDIFTVTWGELSDADVFAKLYKILGNKK